MSPLIPSLLTATLALPVAAADREPDPRGTGVWPLSPAPAVVHGFDPPDSDFGTGHRGVDLAGRPGQVVGAALPGQVVFAGRLAGRGVIVVSHGPTRTTYEPVRATVRVGDLVDAGTPLGVLELPLSHCLPSACLHWGWLRGETYLDPLELVGAGRVRLLPLSGLPPVPTSPGQATGTPSMPGSLRGLPPGLLPPPGSVAAVLASAAVAAAARSA
jgi:murein DD-endopeptidase MepM/ murein hydrolase activator NlpD